MFKHFYFRKNPNEKRLILVAFLLVLIFFLISFCFFPLITVGVFALAIILLFLGIKPEIGLYLMILFLPVIDWNFNFRGFVIPFIDLITIVVLVACFLRIIYFFLFSATELKKIKFPVLLAFSLFFLSISISNLLSDNVSTDLWYSIRWIAFFYFGYLFLPINVIKNERILKNSLICFLISGALVAGLGMVSLSQQDWNNEFVRIRPIGISGIYPIGDNHNLIAEVMVVAIFFVLTLKYWSKSILSRRSINLAVIVFALILLGTFSRAAWLVLFMQAGIYFIYKNRQYAKKIIFPLLVVLVILSPLVIYMIRLQSQYEIGVSSTENRMLMTEIAWQAFREKPFFGQGTGEFIHLVADNIRFRAQYGDPLDSHGLGQKILAENGVFGILAFAGFIFSILAIFYKALKKHKKDWELLLPLVLGSGGVFLFEFFNTSYYKGKMWLPIAIALAAAALIKQKYEREKN
jgi:O-antigen ligase